MDIHRSRFVPYPPSAINALAFSHTQVTDGNDTDRSSLRLAIGRANGDIEIWNPNNGSWLQERVFYGGKDRSVEGLAWTQEPPVKVDGKVVAIGRLRLFSIGYSNNVTEWDLTTGLPVRHSDGNHSAVWCIAAQPKSTVGSTSDEARDLVAGCDDGTLVLFSTADDDLRFRRFLYRATGKKARALCVEYKGTDVVLAGFADSTIRVLDSKKCMVLRAISLGGGLVGGPKEILVWKIRCLPNGNFVAGDSTGHIRIYDGKNFSEIQRIFGHEADLLDLAVARNGTMIMSVGMDRRTCVYSCSTKKKNFGKNWKKLSHRKYHDHDVKAVATYEGIKLNMMVSGGIDTRPVVVPLQSLHQEGSRELPSLPRNPPIASAPDARLMVSWWGCELRIWRIKPQAEGEEKPKVVARLALKGDENISSASMSRDGSLLAVATASEIKLFHLTCSAPGAKYGLNIRKLDLPGARGGKLVRLTGDGKWLAIVTSGDETQLFRIVPNEDEEDLPRVLEHSISLERIEREQISLKEDALRDSYMRSITHAEFSTDGKHFAVADVAGYIDTWVIQGHEDPTAPEIDIDNSSRTPVDDDESSDEEVSDKRVAFLGQQWIRNPSGHALPRLDATPLVLSFQPTVGGTAQVEPNGNPAVHPTRHNPHPRSRDLPSTEQQLLVMSANHQLYLFDVLAGRLSEWSRKNPISKHPSQLRAMINSPAKGCMWDVNEEVQRVWIYGETWLFMFDLGQDLPMPETDQDDAEKSKKRKRQVHSGVPVAKLRKFYGDAIEGDIEPEWTVLGENTKQTGADEDMEDQEDALTSLRRSGPEANGELPPEESGVEADESRSGKLAFWHTFKYRPILGIVPIGSGTPVEAVLVERPSWEVSLPPRFVGNHE